MKTDIQIAQEAELMHIKTWQRLSEFQKRNWSFMESTKRSSPMNSGRT